MLKKLTILSIVTSMVSTSFVNTNFNISNAVTEKASVQSESSDVYQKRFMELWNNINDPQNGYFSDKGVPYHSIETLMCEAPDYGHESTSEAFSYWIWLCAMYGRFTNDWSEVENAWDATEKYIIPSLLDQPGMDKYPATKPASYAPEWEIPDKYPSELSDQVKSGSDPINDELITAYGTDIMYGMHWLLDVDNWYGYGRRGDGRTKPSVINTYQRGPQESVWETVPHPSWDSFKAGWGGKNGFVDLFVKDSAPAKQWRYSTATDADARVVQATYWANKWASELGEGLPDLAQKASKLGDYLRYGMFDKYFRKIGVTGKAGTGGTGSESCHYLLGWYYAWGGGLNGYWSWKIGSSHNHFGYQNPMAAWAMSTQDDFKPKSENGTADWAKSLDRQLDFYTWLQSDEGAIAGGCTNSYNGRYEEFPADTSKFYGMGYDANPVYLDPGSNTWFGFQAWSMQRIAELYYETGNEKAKILMDKWTSWVKNVVKINDDGTYAIPSTISWEGQPYNWEGKRVENDQLHINIVNYGTDLGITGSLANTLLYYSAATKKWGTYDDESRALAKELLDRMWTLYKDEKGLSVEEARGDYKKFFVQEVYIPEGWTGTMANGDVIKSGVKFIDIRSKYRQDPDWEKVETAYKSGVAPVFKYHRFWAQCDIALALGTYSLLFGNPEVVEPSLGPSAAPTPTMAPVRGVVNVKEYNANTTAKASSLRPRFLVTNVSSEPIKLEDFKLRYYFTNEGEEIEPEFTCDSASITNATGFHDNKKYANYEFNYIEEPSEDADYYMEFSFIKGADSLMPGESIKIELRWNKPDWPIFFQDNDYSYNAKDEAPVDWDKTTAYVNGVLQWGKEPSCVKSVLPTPASTPDNNTPGDKTVQGYIKPDFSFSKDVSEVLLADFNVELKGTNIKTKTDSNGKFVLKNVPESETGYNLRVSKSGYLTREVEVSSSGSLDVSTEEKPILLWAGDLAGEDEQDDSINMKDIMVIAKSFNMTKGNDKYSEECDFNMDGSINMNDVIIMARNFNKVSADYSK